MDEYHHTDFQWKKHIVPNMPQDFSVGFLIFAVTDPQVIEDTQEFNLVGRHETVHFSRWGNKKQCGAEPHKGKWGWLFIPTQREYHCAVWLFTNADLLPPNLVSP
jgi:hypothetical protein